MKKSAFFLIWLSTILISCQDIGEESHHNEFYVERELSFMKSCGDYWGGFDTGSYIFEEWVRKPENMLIAHNTFKKIGYQNLLQGVGMDNEWGCDHLFSVWIPCNTLIDSLVITYSPDSLFCDPYYREFWARRRAEKNDSITHLILTEIKAEVIENDPPGYADELVNDTLLNLTQISLTQETGLNPIIARENLGYLMTIGLHQSAYNLFYSYPHNQYLRSSEKKMLKELIPRIPDQDTCGNYLSWF